MEPHLPINSLEALGYSDFFRSQIDAQARAAGWRPGRVVAQHRGEWEVATEGKIVRAILPGRAYEEQDRSGASRSAQPTVGDWVLLSESPSGQLSVIERTLTRRTLLERGAAGRRRLPQTIVANVDVVVVVCAFSPPGTEEAVERRVLNPRRIERYLAAIAQGGAEGWIALNKADLTPEAPRITEELRTRFAPHPVLMTSTTTPGGLDELRRRLTPGQTVGFVGLSGVGKSSLVNGLLGRAVQRTGEERRYDARGRHTTTHRELFATDSGVLLVDTPGMREFALYADDDEPGGFEDLAELAKACRFRNCKHDTEPGCAVTAAVACGELSADRLRSYRQLVEELSSSRRSGPRSGQHALARRARRRRPQPGVAKRR